MAVRVFNSARVRPAENPQQTRTELLARIEELEAENARLQASSGAVVPRQTNPQENDDLQDALDRIADVAEAPDAEESLTEDDLKDKLNKIIDLASESDEDDDSGEE